MEQSTDRADEQMADNPVHSPETTEATPAWLKMLEEQSYQAELLISGLLVAGLFQFPDLIAGGLEGFLMRSNEVGFYYLSTAGLLMLSASNSLLLFFAFHFFLRIIWVALLGLNSVYPNGINEASQSGSGPRYWQMAKAKYPNLSAYNLELDRQCSVIFSLATGTFITVTAISVLIVIVYWIFAGLMNYFPVVGEYALSIGLGLYVLFMLVAMTIQWLSKKYPTHPRVERLTDVFGDVVSGLFSFYFFRKPLGYISGILVSNANSKRFLFIMAIAGFLMGLVGGVQTDNYPAFQYFHPDRYLSFNDKPTHHFAFNYDNLRDPEQRVLTPFIEADRVKGANFKLFIPIIEREKPAANIEELSFWEKLKHSRAERDSIKLGNLQRYATFNEVYIDSSSYTGLKFQYYELPHHKQQGLLLYIPTTGLASGRHLLQIRKQYYVGDKQKVVTIPFHFEQ